MASYLFDLGNPTQGPIGYHARVTASTPEHALEVLKLGLETIGRKHRFTIANEFDDKAELGPIEVCFNPVPITLGNIVADETIDDSEDDGTNGQDRESYSDTQDRESYSVDPRD